MSMRKLISRRLLYGSLIVSAVFVVLLGAAILNNAKSDPKLELATSDRTVPNEKVELCSPYANLCFDRPSTWTRSSILHVNGSVDNTIEINPPTGTILQLSKTGKHTSTQCDKTAYKECIIKVSKIEKLQNNLNVVTGMLISSPDANCRESCAMPKYTPFVQLMSQSSVDLYDLEKDTSTFDEFNPTVHIEKYSSVYLGITPGKQFDVINAESWLAGEEAKTAQSILSSARLAKH